MGRKDRSSSCGATETCRHWGSSLVTLRNPLQPGHARSEKEAKTVAKLSLREPRTAPVPWKSCLWPDPLGFWLLSTSRDPERPGKGEIA